MNEQVTTKPGVYLSVVIPAYNEEKRLPATLNSVIGYLSRQKYSSEILVVDDGSKDGTRDVVAKFIQSQNWKSGVLQSGIQNVACITYPDGQNHGKGYAVRFGMLAAKGKFRVFMDADNSTTIDHVERFFPIFKTEDYDVVIGSRHLNESDVEVHQVWYKEMAGDLGNIFIRMMAVPGVYDTQAGFKMFKAEVVEKVFPLLTIDRWGFDIEILAAARRQGYRIKEAPITWINDPNSKVSAKAYVEVLGEVIRIRRNMWRGIYNA